MFKQDKFLKLELKKSKHLKFLYNEIENKFKKMIRKSKYTSEYKKGKCKNPIPFPHIIISEQKKVYFKIEDGWPASLSVKPIMREHFPDDFTGIIASVETWEELMKGLDPNKKTDSNFTYKNSN